jgi:hypothetical protein
MVIPILSTLLAHNRGRRCTHGGVRAGAKSYATPFNNRIPGQPAYSALREQRALLPVGGRRHFRRPRPPRSRGLTGLGDDRHELAAGAKLRDLKLSAPFLSQIVQSCDTFSDSPAMCTNVDEHPSSSRQGKDCSECRNTCLNRSLEHVCLHLIRETKQCSNS